MGNLNLVLQPHYIEWAKAGNLSSFEQNSSKGSKKNSKENKKITEGFKMVTYKKIDFLPLSNFSNGGLIHRGKIYYMKTQFEKFEYYIKYINIYIYIYYYYLLYTLNLRTFFQTFRTFFVRSEVNYMKLKLKQKSSKRKRSF